MPSRCARRLPVRASRTTGTHGFVAVKRSRLPCCSYGWATMVDGCPLDGILPGHPLLFPLCTNRPETPVPGNRQLVRRRVGGGSSRTSVVADMRDSDVLNHRFVVDISYVGGCNVVHNAVVIEPSAIPVASLVAVASVAIPVIDTAVIPNCRSPVAFVPNIHTVVPRPIPGRP